MFCLYFFNVLAGPASIFSNLGSQIGSPEPTFSVFLFNGDFAKIVLPLWREPNFEGSDPPKIDPESDSERHRQEKTTKTASGAVSGRTFSPRGSFLVDFGLPAGPQNSQKTAPGRHEAYFGTTLFRFFYVLNVDPKTVCFVF